MENLDLNAYDVQEMNHQEMVETDGGDWLAIGLSVAGCLICCASPTTWVAAAGLAVSTAGLIKAAVDTENGK